MSVEQERTRIKQTMEELETDFRKNRRLFEEQEEGLMYGSDQANRQFDELANSTTYYLRSFGVEDQEFRLAMSIIDGMKEDILTEIKREQKKRESAFEEKQYAYKNQQNQLEDELLSIRSDENAE